MSSSGQSSWNQQISYKYTFKLDGRWYKTLKRTRAIYLVIGTILRLYPAAASTGFVVGHLHISSLVHPGGQI
jgi:hypothetical protein